MGWKIDGGLYPDIEPPSQLNTLSEKVDFIARLFAAWAFGILPDWETVVEIRRVTWQPAVEACRLLTSPTYHLLRRWHHLPALPYLGTIPAYIREDPNLEYV